MKRRYFTFTNTLRTTLVAALLTLAGGTSTAQVTIHGSVYGGGNEADVLTNTKVDISAGTVMTNVYGGGNVGNVGNITKSADYNYTWKQTDGTTTNTHYNNDITENNTNTGVCTVIISGGTIGSKTAGTGNVFGAGRGKDDTWWCEKAIVFATDVSVTAGTVNGNVYGGGEVGRVEDDTKVTIGAPSGTDNLEIKGSVFGAGAGKKTHGYSALVRGNADVTVQGKAKVGGNVYGGGEIASVGRFKVIGGLPSKPQSGGTCKVSVKDQAEITGSVFGACKGVESEYVQSDYKTFCSMQTYTNGTKDKNNNPLAEDTYWNYYETDHTYIWRYYPTEAEYLEFLKTLALTSNTEVAIAGSSTIDGSVYGGGELGVTLGNSTVDMLGGTVSHHVFGGGSLADTNTAMWDADNNRLYDYVELDLINGLSHVTGYYEKSGDNYTLTTDATAQSGHTYYAVYKTNVNLLGGTIRGDAYGGGLGRLAKAAVGIQGEDGYVAAITPIEAKVYGDVKVNLNGMTVGEYATASASTKEVLAPSATNGNGDNDTTDADEDYHLVSSKGCIVNRVFGCNDLNGSPQDNVTVHVFATQNTSKEVVGDKFINDNLDLTKGASETDAAYLARLKGIHAKEIALATALSIITDSYQVGETATASEVKTAIEGITGAINAKTTAEINAVKYDLKAVYGGGNEAAYNPITPYHPTTAATGSKVQVIIDGCDYTSIETVYGGGNAAPVPEANVTVNAAYEIETVFGGGNGRDNKESDGSINEGADIGTLDQGSTTYGTGNANTLISGGYIHEAYGGSNERGTIMGTVNLRAQAGTACDMLVKKMVTAGKNADIMGDAITVLGCMPDSWVDEFYGGADNANVHGDVELTITSGNFKKVFGGNNRGGIIMGHIKVNIEETGCIPINIDELYLGGNEAPYSYYGYYVNKDDENNPILSSVGKLTFKPRESATDSNKAVKRMFRGYTYEEYSGGEGDTFSHYDNQPELNIISCTHIGKVFGGGLGVPAVMYADPTVNINMIQGRHAATSVPAKMTELGLTNAEKEMNSQNLGIIGTVYGGGNAADVIGNPTVNIGTKSTVDLVSTAENKPVLGAYILGNVFGGGKGADDSYTCEKAMVGIDGEGETNPTGGTRVNIYNGFVRGNVYGGGEIGRVEKNTVVNIGNGDGVASGETPTSAPIIMGNVFGGGKGKETHGYAALVRGNPTVTVQGNAKVLKSVYGGGEIASVARYNVPKTETEVQQAIAAGYTEAKLGMPYALKDPNSGTCTVIVRGYAEIGPATEMQMTKTGGPDDTGYVFGAGKGILPGGEYEFASGTTRRMVLYDANDHKEADQGTKWQWVDYPNHSESNNNVWEYFEDLDEYITFIQTLALSSRTDVTITGNAFVKGSVYGGSENGIVQFDTDVKIQGGQIGWGSGETGAHPDTYWTTNSEDPTKFAECPSWTFQSPYAPYDPYATTLYNGKYYYDTNHTQEAAGGAVVATDGHTFYGNVFGGGSGSVPYFDHALGRSVYLHSAGQVKGDTYVTISGGHILTNVYGGCEATNVNGTANVTMTGGTVGVPRTDDDIIAHPLTGYIFGGGKGDQRIFFNKDTNVKDAVVTIEGGRVYGSVYGGGEDGHVMRNVTLTIGKQTTTGEGTQAVTTTSGPKIGTKGTSYYDGHVFGGGRGFGGEALTAGNVGGSVDMDILGGDILGSVYGGGRLASVGYGLYLTTETGYGLMRADGQYDGSYTNPSTDPATSFFTKGRGYIDIKISGGTIGNNLEYIIPNATNIAAAGIQETDISKWDDTNKYWDTWKNYHNISETVFDPTNGRLSHTKGGNVFAGGMGRREQLDGVTPIDAATLDWHKLGNVKSTKVTISGSAWIKSNVYGGGELGAVRSYYEGSLSNPTKTEGGNTEVNINGGTIGTMIGPNIAASGTKDTGNTSGDGRYTFGSVYGGGYGTEKDILDDPSTSTVGDAIPYNKNMEYFAALIVGNAEVTMTSGTVLGSVFGGGEVACIGGSTKVEVSGGKVGVNELRDNGYVLFGGSTMGNVFGGGRGSEKAVNAGLVRSNTTVTISGTPEIYHNVYGGGALGSVGWFTFTDGAPTECSEGTGTAAVTITGGTIGINGWDNGMVDCASRGGEGNPNATGSLLNQLAWVKNTVLYIGESNTTGPTIKGSAYGGGENGHNFGNAEVLVHSGTIGHDAKASYENGNVYGAGCGTDTYTEGGVKKYNPMAGCVWGNATLTIDGGTVLHNVYGAGSMGSVGKTVTTDGVTTITSGGKTTVTISGGIVGYDGVGNGNVFGAARGDETTNQTDLALAKETSVNISSNAIVKGSVYGGGEAGDVTDDAEVNVCADYDETNKVYVVTTASGTPTIGGNVYGGGKGSANSFECAKAMVGIVNQGVDAQNNLQPGGTAVRIYNGTVGTLVGTGQSQTLKTGTGNVYGGGEIARVERNTVVEIGAATGNSTPTILGSVFGAGAGKATHGYSALVRGTSTVTVQGDAQVLKNVYGGGELASVGRYKVKIANGNPSDSPATLPAGMPYGLKAGGASYVNILGSATIGTDNVTTTGHVYGAGQGIEPTYVYNGTYTGQTLYTTRITNSKRMANYTSAEVHPTDKQYIEWDYYEDDEGHQDTRYVWEYFPNKPAFLQFIETLAISADTYVTIGGKRDASTGVSTPSGNPTVKGSVFGGSESGFVYRNTDVKIQGGTVKGDAFGGGRGLASFAEAGRVRWNTNLAVSGGIVEGNVYGGGNLGDVGTINKEASGYNYAWKNTDANGNNLDPSNDNAANNNTISDNDNKNTGICTVNISGGEIGIDNPAEKTKHGNVFGAGQGLANTFWCEKAMAFATNVNVSAGTVKGNVYGGGEVGRVGDDTKVTIGVPSEADNLEIKGSVFGAGAGKATHGYSALVRGNADVTVQGKAKVGASVYGGGEIASVGRFTLDSNNLPKEPVSGGTCTVAVKDQAEITANVFGACKGVTPNYVESGDDKSKCMKTFDKTPPRDPNSAHPDWEYYADDHTYVWEYFADEDAYLAFLKTLALTNNTHTTISGTASVSGSVYGGGEMGITLGGTDVNIAGGTVSKDVYGGGALADTNYGMWDAENSVRKTYVALPNLIVGSSATGYYTEPDDVTSLITASDAKVESGKTYYAIYKTNVNLTGGTVEGDVYGGGLGRLEAGTVNQTGYVSPIEAMVYGDVLVTLNGTKLHNTTRTDDQGNTITATGRIFGCNNLNGSPKGGVTVHAYRTVPYSGTTHVKGTYEVAAIYGGGNLAMYDPVNAATGEKTNVIIDGCDCTSIYQVYGGGNAASTPATNVTVNGTFEIEEVFGGGNGKDRIQKNNVWLANPGANVGYYEYPDGTDYDTRNDLNLAAGADPVYTYGSGEARVSIYGGTTHAIYGGSNTKGNVRKTAVALLDGLDVEHNDATTNTKCAFDVDEAYGGGKSADMDGQAILKLICIDGLSSVYGGAENADVNNDVTLNITNGTYGQVFGGNNIGGRINGSITVNIEETGCKPIILGELYGGGNRAAYSVYGYKPETNSDGSIKYDDNNKICWQPLQAGETVTIAGQTYTALAESEKHAHPVVNAKSFSSIGTVFGGGYGRTAVMVADPEVNINVVESKYEENGEDYGIEIKETDDRTLTIIDENDDHTTTTRTVTYPSHEKGKIGAINRVFGGGNAAAVIGNPTVNIGTKTGEEIELVSLSIKDSDGKEPTDSGWTPTYMKATVMGADIRGNVYGGGNEAEVHGNTKVNIGKRNE